MTFILHPVVLPIVFPFLAGLVCLLLPRGAYRTRSSLAVASAAMMVVLVWPLFSKPGALLELAQWFTLKVDGLSAFVLLAIAVFGFLIAVYSVGYMRGRERHRAYFAYLLWTLGASCGAVLANDLLVLMIFWGFLALTLYLMIGLAGPDAAEAARKSLMIVGGTDALLVFGVVLLWSLSETTRMDSGAIPVSGTAAHIAFLAFVAAAFAKTGAVPFHAWVPECGAKALVPVTALLPASLDKLLGIYLLVRCVTDLFELTAAMQTMLMFLGAVTVIIGGLMALIQRDLKVLLAYSSISQVGYMVLGIGCVTPLGLAAALFHMLNNTIYKCCLFLCAGAVERSAGTTDIDQLGGLGKAMPLTFSACAVAALAIAGVPPLNGFASKWMIYQSIIETGEAGGPGWIIWLAAAMLGSALTLAAIMKVLHGVFLCKPAPNVAGRTIREAGPSLVLPMVALATSCIVFGVFAHAVPLDLLIFPAVPVEVPGVWWAGPATILILIAVGLGAIVYAATMTAGKLRRCETYIGGEQIDDVYIRGEEQGPTRHVEVTGADFYTVIETLPGLRRLYALARANVFDVYEVGAKSASYFVSVLRGAHTGALSSYLTWLLAGVLAVVYAVTQLGGGND
jgi:formate hydrogenlyase subunit 3/multisubunit Na+/H+ antiporter MnhD subunit